jgi:putative ABC transport system permease protein
VAIVSEELAKTYGRHVGDRVPIRSRIWTNKSGEPIWPVDIVGIYRSENTLLVGAMLLQFRYLDEGRIAGRGMVNSFLVRVSDPAQAELVAPAIDRSFANSAYETKTSSEQQIARDTVKRVGDIGLIINAVNGAVLFALILSVGAVMIQTGRERRTEVGVLKALGYSDLGVLALVVGEAMLTCVLAGAFGLGLAAMALPIVAGMTHLSMVEGRSVLLPGLGLAGALGFLTGLPPAVSALRLRVADVLAGR